MSPAYPMSQQNGGGNTPFAEILFNSADEYGGRTKHGWKPGHPTFVTRDLIVQYEIRVLLQKSQDEGSDVLKTLLKSLDIFIRKRSYHNVVELRAHLPNHQVEHLLADISEQPYSLSLISKGTKHHLSEFLIGKNQRILSLLESELSHTTNKRLLGILSNTATVRPRKDHEPRMLMDISFIMLPEDGEKVTLDQTLITGIRQDHVQYLLVNLDLDTTSDITSALNGNHCRYDIADDWNKARDIVLKNNYDAVLFGTSHNGILQPPSSYTKYMGNLQEVLIIPLIEPYSLSKAHLYMDSPFSGFLIKPDKTFLWQKMLCKYMISNLTAST